MKKFLIILVTIIGSVFVTNLAFADGNVLPEIYIKAINPGYTVDGVSNVGEMIEIGRVMDSDEPLSLTGLTISYTNSSGNETVLVEFPENSWMVGEKILLRLASSPGHELASVLYMKTLAAKAGPLTIRRGEEVVDSVCWTGKEGCYKDFKTTNPTTLVRNTETGFFEHVADYEPEYVVENYREDVVKEEPLPSQCKGLMFSEVLTYYESEKSEQFIEVYNSSAEQILMAGCSIRYKNKLYGLDEVIKPEEYKVKYFDNISLTKNPTNKNTLEIIDVNGDVVDKLEILNGQRKGASYAWIGFDAEGAELWRVTYALTPGEANYYQEYKTCEAGKVINKETGNCVNVTEVITKVCKDGYYLNLLTGRCNKTKTTTAKTCKEGYRLNEETGRCIKIKENTGANYALQKEEYEESSSFVALYVVLGVVGVGLIYIIYEFWGEILKFWRKVFRRFH